MVGLGLWVLDAVILCGQIFGKIVWTSRSRPCGHTKVNCLNTFVKENLEICKRSGGCFHGCNQSRNFISIWCGKLSAIDNLVIPTEWLGEFVTSHEFRDLCDGVARRVRNNQILFSDIVAEDEMTYLFTAELQ